VFHFISRIVCEEKLYCISGEIFLFGKKKSRRYEVRFLVYDDEVDS